MNQESTAGVQGPAWTRKKYKRHQVHQTPVHDIYGGGGGGNGVGSSSSSLSLHELPPPASSPTPVQREAPYLTHTVRNPLGQVTLVPPDNLGRVRQAHSVDPELPQPQQLPPQAKVKKVRKPKKIQAATEADPAILDAVLNAGRRASPIDSGAGQTLNNGLHSSNTNGFVSEHASRTARPAGTTTSGLTAEPVQRSRSAQSNAERRNVRARAAQTRADAAAAAADDANASQDRSGHPFTRSSSTLSSSDVSRVPTTCNDSRHLDSHASLLPSRSDRAQSESPPPPPAYVRPPTPPLLDQRVPSPTPQASSSLPAPLVPVPASTNLAASRPLNPQQPPSLQISSPDALQSRFEASGPQVREETDDDDDQDPLMSALLPILNPPPAFDTLDGSSDDSVNETESPDLDEMRIDGQDTSLEHAKSAQTLYRILARAWTRDRQLGLGLDERIERDLERRRRAGCSDPETVPRSEISDSSAMTAGTGPASESTPPRLGRALSVYAGRRIAEAAERRREREAARTRRGSALGIEEENETEEGNGDENDTDQLAAVAAAAPRPPVDERSDLVENGSRTSDDQRLAQGSTQTPAELQDFRQGDRVEEPQSRFTEATPEQQDKEADEQSDVVEEVEEESESSADEDESAVLARQVTITAHRRFAEAAERRIKAEKEAREAAAREQHRREEGESASSPGVPIDSSSTEDGTASKTMSIDEELTTTNAGPSDRGIETHSESYLRLFPTPARPFGAPATIPMATQPTPAPRPPSSGAPLMPIAPRQPEMAQNAGRDVPAEEQRLHDARAEDLATPPTPTGSSSPAPQQTSNFEPSVEVAKPIPQTAFSDLVRQSPTAPLARPRAPTINELLERQPSLHRPQSQTVRPSAPDPPSTTAPLRPRPRPPPVPPSRPNSILNRPHPLRSGLTSERLQRMPSAESRAAVAPALPRRPPPPPPPPASSSAAVRNSARLSTQPDEPRQLDDEPTDQARPASRSSIDSSILRSPGSGFSARRRPLPIPPTPPTATATPRVDAYTALMSRVEQSEREQARQAALSRLEGQHLVTTPLSLSQSQSDFATLDRGSVSVGRTSLEPPVPRPRSATSSLEVPPEPAVPAEDSERSEQQQQQQASSERSQENRRDEFAAYTDLDLLLARLEGDQARAGQDYDDLTVLSEVLGPARAIGSSAAELEDLAVARVELERRRIDKHGKVKQKLSVVGVRCVDCAVCLARFRVDDLAVVLPHCLHAFHEKCIRSWLARSRQCPLCRAEVFPPRNDVEPESNDGTASIVDV